MSLTLYFHPFSSYCQKALIALYENETPFAPRHINLGDPADAAALKALWGARKFPVLRDEARAETIPESSIIIEYLAQHYPGPSKLIPADGDAARRVSGAGIGGKAVGDGIVIHARRLRRSARFVLRQSYIAGPRPQEYGRLSRPLADAAIVRPCAERGAADADGGLPVRPGIHRQLPTQSYALTGDHPWLSAKSHTRALLSPAIIPRQPAERLG